MEIDDEGMIKLVRGAMQQAERDAKNGDHEAEVFLSYMRNGDAPANKPTAPDWEGLLKRADALLASAEAGLSGKPAQSHKTHPPAAPAPLTADEIAENARLLTDLGISPEWARIQADPVKMAAMERQQKRRDFAARLGLNPAYVTDEMVEASNG